MLYLNNTYNIYIYICMMYVCMIGVEVCCRKSLWRSCHFGGWSITLGISQVLSLERRWEKAFVDPSGFHNVGFWGLVIFEVWPLKTGKIGIDAGLENGSPHDLQVVGLVVFYLMFLGCIFTLKFGTIMKWSNVTHIIENTGWPKTPTRRWYACCSEIC